MSKRTTDASSLKKRKALPEGKKDAAKKPLHRLLHHPELFHYVTAFLYKVDEIPLHVAFLQSLRLDFASWYSFPRLNAFLFGRLMLICAIEHGCMTAAEWLRSVAHVEIVGDCFQLAIDRKTPATLEWLLQHVTQNELMANMHRGAGLPNIMDTLIQSGDLALVQRALPKYGTKLYPLLLQAASSRQLEIAHYLLKQITRENKAVGKYGKRKLYVARQFEWFDRNGKLMLLSWVTFVKVQDDDKKKTRNKRRERVMLVKEFFACAGGMETRACTLIMFDPGNEDPEEVLVNLAVRSKNVELLERLYHEDRPRRRQEGHNHSWWSAWLLAAAEGDVPVMEWLDQHSQDLYKGDGFRDAHYDSFGDFVDDDELFTAANSGNLELFQWCLARPRKKWNADDSEDEGGHDAPEYDDDVHDESMNMMSISRRVKRALAEAFQMQRQNILEWFFKTHVPSRRVKDEIVNYVKRMVHWRFVQRTFSYNTDDETIEKIQSDQLAYIRWFHATLPALMSYWRDHITRATIDVGNIEALRFLLEHKYAELSWEDDNPIWFSTMHRELLEMLEFLIVHWGEGRSNREDQPQPHALNWSTLLETALRAGSRRSFHVVWKHVKATQVNELDWTPQGWLDARGQVVDPFIEYLLEKSVDRPPQPIEPRMWLREDLLRLLEGSPVSGFLKQERKHMLTKKEAKPAHEKHLTLTTDEVRALYYNEHAKYEYLCAKLMHPNAAKRRLSEEEAEWLFQLEVDEKLLDQFEANGDYAACDQTGLFIANSSARITKWMLPRYTEWQSGLVDDMVGMAFDGAAQNCPTLLEQVFALDPTVFDRKNAKAARWFQILGHAQGGWNKALMHDPIIHGHIDVLQFLIDKHVIKPKHPIVHVQSSLWERLIRSTPNALALLRFLYRNQLIPGLEICRITKKTTRRSTKQQHATMQLWRRMANMAAASANLPVLQWLYYETKIPSAKCTGRGVVLAAKRKFTSVLEWLQQHDPTLMQQQQHLLKM